MSHHALQRALVVALHDPGFVRGDARRPGRRAGALRPRPRRAGPASRGRSRAPSRSIRLRRAARAQGDRRGAQGLDGHRAGRDPLARLRRRASSPRRAFRAAVHRGPVRWCWPSPTTSAARAGGALTSPHLPGVLAIERARAEARRDRDRVPRPRSVAGARHPAARHRQRGAWPRCRRPSSTCSSSRSCPTSPCATTARRSRCRPGRSARPLHLVVRARRRGGARRAARAAASLARRAG